MTEQMPPGENLHIAPLSLSDTSVLTKLYQLFQRAYLIEAELIAIAATEFPPLKRTQEQFVEANRAFLGCWENTHLAAAVEYDLYDSQLMIHSLVVDPSFFRQGLASRLLAYLLTNLRWRYAEVETGVANTPAIALYQKFGFIELRRWLTPENIAKIALSIRR